MKLTEMLKKLFRKDKELTVTEILNIADNAIETEKHGNENFVKLYAVVSISNGYKTIMDGIKTKAEAKAIVGCNYDLFINPYWVKK